MLSIMAEQQPKKLHVAVFPWLAFGHIIPFFELSKLIAQKGHKISFISTPGNIKRLPQIPTSLKTLINLISIPLPPTNNLPENAEATTDIPPHIVPYLKIAFDNLQDPLVQFLQNSNPDWIIHDFAPHWLPPIASKLGIFRNFFSIYNASTLSFLLDSLVPEFHAEERIKPEDFTVPPTWVSFPSRVAFRLHEARKFFVHFEENKSGVSDIFRMKTIFVGADVLSPRSCREIEGEYLDVIQDFSGKTVIPIGLLPPSIQIRDEDSKSDGNWDKINEWLNKQQKRSVVYVAFGSELPLTQEDITELALGLELSGLPFFWVLRKMDSAYQLPDGFERRCSGRGTVWMEWAPQARILGHKSTGGFLTHCGWSSVIESLHVGCPLILLPFQMDQGLISRLLDDKRLGAEVSRDEESGKFTRESLAKSLKLVVMEEEGKVYRNEAKEMSKIFGDMELQYKYVDNLICHFESVSLKSKLA